MKDDIIRVLGKPLTFNIKWTSEAHNDAPIEGISGYCLPPIEYGIKYNGYSFGDHEDDWRMDMSNIFLDLDGFLVRLSKYDMKRLTYWEQYIEFEKEDRLITKDEMRSVILALLSEIKDMER